MSPALAGRFFTTSATWEKKLVDFYKKNLVDPQSVSSTGHSKIQSFSPPREHATTMSNYSPFAVDELLQEA